MHMGGCHIRHKASKIHPGQPSMTSPEVTLPTRRACWNATSPGTQRPRHLHPAQDLHACWPSSPRLHRFMQMVDCYARHRASGFARMLAKHAQFLCYMRMRCSCRRAAAPSTQPRECIQMSGKLATRLSPAFIWVGAPAQHTASGVQSVGQACHAAMLHLRMEGSCARSRALPSPTARMSEQHRQ